MMFRGVFLLMFFGLLSMPQALASEDQGGEINQKDARGRKQGKWIFFGKDRPEAGYPAEGKIEEGPFKDDRKEGLWVKYHNDGVTPRLKGNYINNRPSGQYIKLYPNGTIKEIGTFDRNKYYDSLKRFHENGVVEYEANYNAEGKEDGAVKFYYPNGQVEFEYESVDGVATGKATRYYENGDIKEVIMYAEDGSVESSDQLERVNPSIKVDDPGESREMAPKVNSPRTKGTEFKANGYNKVYNEGDDLWQDGDFRNGRLWDGKVYEYDSDGILLKVKVFKKGVYHSDGQL